jgi:hypothetical protein
MNAIKKVRKHLQAHPDSENSRILGALVEALGEERSFPLADLYRLDFDAFELALALLEDWRLDRYYASRLKLFDVAQVGGRLIGEFDAKPAEAAPAASA